MNDKLIEVLLCEIKTLQRDLKVVSTEVVNLRLENQELKAELHQLKNFFMPENSKPSFKFWTLLVTTIGGAVAGLIAIINNMVMHK
jgi:regulator of replication initiation timing